MRAAKRYLYLTDTEWRIMLLAPNELRSRLIAQGRYTDRQHKFPAEMDSRTERDADREKGAGWSEQMPFLFG